MHNFSSDPSQCRFTLSASKSLPRFLPFASMTQNALHLTQIGGQPMQRKLCYLHVQVLFQFSIWPVRESYNFPTFPSKIPAPASPGLSVLLRLDDKIDRNTILHFPLAPYVS